VTRRLVDILHLRRSIKYNNCIVESCGLLQLCAVWKSNADNALDELVQDEDMSNGVDVVSDFLILYLRDRLRLRHQLTGSHWRFLSHAL